MSDKKLSNLERIKLAWSLGFSAQFKSEEEIMTIVSINDPKMIFGVRNTKGEVSDWSSDPDYCLGEWENTEITSWLYAGELAGTGKIPDKTKFRVRKTGEIVSYDYKSNGEGELMLNCRLQNSQWNEPFYPTEIEPFFD